MQPVVTFKSLLDLNTYSLGDPLERHMLSLHDRQYDVSVSSSLTFVISRVNIIIGEVHTQNPNASCGKHRMASIIILFSVELRPGYFSIAS